MAFAAVISIPLQIPVMVSASESLRDCTSLPASETDYTYCNFNSKTLNVRDFSNKDLTGSSFKGACFTRYPHDSNSAVRTSFENSILTGVDFTSAKFRYRTCVSISESINLDGGVVFRGANLTRVNLSNVALGKSNLENAFGTELTLRNTNFSSTTATAARLTDIVGTITSNNNFRLINGNLVGAVDTDVTNLNLSNADLRFLRGNNRDYSGSDLSGSNLTNSLLPGANLQNVNLSGANLIGVRSGGIVGSPLATAGVQVSNSGHLVANGTYLANADLSGLNLQGFDLRSNDLSGVLSGDLTGNPQLAPEWKILGGYLVGPTANLVGADLRNLDLRKQNLTGIRTGNNQTEGALLPTGWTARGGFLLGPKVNLNNATLDGLDLNGVNLTQVSFGSTSVVGTRFAGATLTGSSGQLVGVPETMAQGWIVLADGRLIGQGQVNSSATFEGADFTGANLTGSTFLGSNLQGAVFKSVNLTGVALASSDLLGVSSENVVGKPYSLPKSWQIVDGFLIGPGASFVGSNFERKNLASANFSYVTSGGITGTPKSLPKSWLIRSGYLIGPKANLTNADLAGANLSGANLTGADLSRANLSGANLTGANLSKANLLEANLSGANLTGALLSESYLVEANLSGANFTKANFTKANLSNANLVDANLTDVNLNKGNLYRARFSNANLLRANLLETSFSNTDFSNADLNNAKVTCSQTDGLIGTPAGLPYCWTLVNGRVTQKVVPSVSIEPYINGTIYTDIFGSNRLTRVSAAWSGTPAVEVTFKWLVCTSKITKSTGRVPSSCRVIPNETTEELALYPSFKGKYIAIVETGTNGYGSPKIVVSKSTAKIQ